MANEVIITSVCRACNGTGIDSQASPSGPVESPCENCDATGRVTASDGQVNADAKISGSYFDDVIDKFSDMDDRCDIIEEKIAEIKAVVDEIKTVVDGL